MSEQVSLNRISPKEEIFVLEYLKDLDAQHAAVRAGFPRLLGAKLLRKAAVKQEVEKAMAARAVRVGINADRVLQELGTLLLGDVSMLYIGDGLNSRMKTPDEMTPEEAKMIVGVKTRRGLEIGEDGQPQPVEITEYKLVDKTALLSLAMRHFGMFKDTLTIDVSSLAQRMMAAQARMNGAPTPLALPAPQDAEFEIDGVKYNAEGEIVDELINVEDWI